MTTTSGQNTQVAIQQTSLSVDSHLDQYYKSIRDEGKEMFVCGGGRSVADNTNGKG